MTIFPTVSEPDTDPYLWLEEIEGAKALAFVEQQNARTLSRFGDFRLETDTAALTAIFDSPDNIPYVSRRGSHLYNLWKDTFHPRGIWRRTTLASYRSESPDWEILLDVDALAISEGEDWIWQGIISLPPTHDRAILRLSRGGADAAVLREFDLASKSFITGGFQLPEAKQDAVWLNRDRLLVFSTLGEGQATTSGYARTIRHWRRGESFSSAQEIFAIPADHMSAAIEVDRTVTPPVVWFYDTLDFFNFTAHVGDATGPRQRLDLPTDATWMSHGDFIAIKPRKPWSVNGATYAPDTLLGGRISDFLQGRPQLEILFEPSERHNLKSFFWAGDMLVLSILDNLHPRFAAYKVEAGRWLETPLPPLPQEGVVNLWAFDGHAEEVNGDLAIFATDPITPASFLLAERGKAPELLKRAPAAFNADGLTITHHEAVSSDGERIPYVQIGPKETKDNEPVLMGGYGGFGIPEAPYYRSAVGKLWLEKGGTYVLAHLRGGGEFGTRWHEAGKREHKARSHDDFAAIAADLVKRKLTTPKRIAAEGGSNGGLLIANMLTRYPERFGALFCTIPVIDMRRYTKLLAGASWIAEYGDPDDPKDWAHLQKISAYHNVELDRPYPPILIATSRKDDRVHPGHARKMAAKLLQLGHETWFYEPAAGGHGYGKDNRERAGFTALGYAFLRRSIGWEQENPIRR